MTPTALHVFDLDGTLLRGTTASLEIARAHGCTTQTTAIEADFAAGRLTPHAFATALHQLWQHLDERTVREAFDAAPWMEHIPDVLADIRARGEHSALITLSPDTFARHARDLGFDHIAASRFPSLPLSATPPDAEGILTPADKVTITDRLLNEAGLRPARRVAYGDSGSDLPLFQALPHTVAVNAVPKLARAAASHFNGPDLAGAYSHARTLLDEPPGNSRAPLCSETR